MPPCIFLMFLLPHGMCHAVLPPQKLLFILHFFCSTDVLPLYVSYCVTKIHFASNSTTAPSKYYLCILPNSCYTDPRPSGFQENYYISECTASKMWTAICIFLRVVCLNQLVLYTTAILFVIRSSLASELKVSESKAFIPWNGGGKWKRNGHHLARIISSWVLGSISPYASNATARKLGSFNLKYRLSILQGWVGSYLQCITAIIPKFQLKTISQELFLPLHTIYFM